MQALNLKCGLTIPSGSNIIMRNSRPLPLVVASGVTGMPLTYAPILLWVTATPILMSGRVWVPSASKANYNAAAWFAAVKAQWPLGVCTTVLQPARLEALSMMAADSILPLYQLHAFIKNGSKHLHRSFIFFSESQSPVRKSLKECLIYSNLRIEHLPKIPRSRIYAPCSISVQPP